ncbi:MAG: hypothetical protein HYV93_15515 [Candidatus Rokubacteria bacterium]|nr:hypothetical protein [Candidatus Rokubacteria bacterium]
MGMRHIVITAAALVTAVASVATPAQAAEQKGSSTMQQAKTGVSDSWVTGA